MAGVKPAYLAAQLGHSIKILLDKHARWIPANDHGTERLAMVVAMGATTRPPKTERDQPK